MKNRGMTIFMIVLLSILAIVLVVGMVFMMRGNSRFGRTIVSDNLVLDETYKNVYSVVKVKTDASNIEVKRTNDSTARVVVYGDEKRTSVDSTGETLSVTSSSRKCFGFCFNMEIDRVIVYLPKSFSGTIDLENKYGDVNVESFEEASVQIKEDCGDIMMDAIHKAEVENSYGDIKIGRAEVVRVKEDCGDVKIDYVRDGTIRNSLGDIEIGKVDGRVEIVEDCGNVKVDEMILNSNSSIENSFGDIRIGSTNEIYIDASVSLGDVNVRNNYRNSEVTLRIKNNCGDIEVKN